MFEWEAVYFQLLVNLEQGLLKSLFSLLRQHQDNFIKTLDERPPKKELRDKIQKKETVKSGEAYKRISGKVDEIIKLSDALKLNEHDVVELLVKVESKPGDLVQNSKILYYGNRSFMLYSLLTILNVAFDVTRSAEIRAPLGNFVQELFVSGLIEKLIRTIEVNVTKPKDAYIIKEQTALSNILFTLFYVSPSSLKSVRSMVGLLQSTSLAFEKQRKTLSNADLKQSHDYFLLASLSMSLLAAFQVGGDGLQLENGQLVTLMQEMNTFVNESEKKSGMADFAVIVGFAWGLYLFSLEVHRDEAADMIRKTVEKGAFGFLNATTESIGFFANQTTPLFLELLAHSLDAFILSPLNIVREMKRVDEAIWDPENEDFDKKDDKLENFRNLMRFITQLYRQYHEGVAKFWGTTHGTNHFQEFVRTIESQYSFPLYIEMLASIASSPESAFMAFMYLKDAHSTKINWTSFFTWIHTFLGSFQQNVQREVSREEFDLLTGILRLLRAVVEFDDKARHSLYTNRFWRPLETLFNLLACPIPPGLKAETLATIQAFASSHELVPQIWQHLENVIASAEGIQRELVCIEVKYQEYPYLDAYLDIIHSLITVMIPEDLSIESKNPGIIAHLKFIIDEVILRFDKRGYKDPAAKWIIASKALQVVLTLLEGYTATSQDFERQYRSVKDRKFVLPKPPGFELMRKFLDNSDHLLRAVMSIITNGEQALRSDPDVHPASEAHLRSIENCLRILNVLLEKQAEFIDLSRKAKNPVGNLFAFQNNRQLTEWLHSLTYYLHENNRIKLLTVNILYHISRHDKMQVIMTNAIYQLSQPRVQFIEGITNCLEIPRSDDRQSLDDKNVMDEDDFQQTLSADNSIRMAVLRLLLHSLESPSPKNLAFLSLGFDINRSIESIDLNKDSPVNPLHSILSILQGQSFTQQEPQLAELCYKFIYKLCKTTMTMMSYIKSNKFDLFAHQIQQLDTLKVGDESLPSQLLWRAWFLRIVSLDVFLTSKTSTAQKMHITSLFASRRDQKAPMDNFEDHMELQQDNRMVMRSLLDVLDIQIAPPAGVSPFLDGVSQLLESSNIGDPSCSRVNEFDLVEYNLKVIHQKLLIAEAALSKRTGGNYTRARHEILGCVAGRHAYTLKSSACCEFLQAWRQLVFATLEHFSVLSESEREEILYELLEGLLSKLKLDLLPSAMQVLAASVLLLTQKLHQQCKLNQHRADESKGLPVDRLSEIFRALNEGIIRSVSSTGIVRCNLYLSLINYLHFTQRQSVPFDPNSISMEEEIQINSIHHQRTRLEQANAAILDSYGNQIVCVIAKDACAGVHLLRSSSFSLLDLLMKYDSNHQWVGIIERQGYLKNFILDFDRQDPLLADLLKPGVKTVNEMLVYSAKMSFLASVADAPGGAELLIENRLIEQLHDCQFVDQTPDTSQNDGVLTMYHQLVEPLLQLLAGILNALPGSSSATGQVVIFIENHFDLFSMTLRETIVTLAGLKKLELATRVFLLALRSNASAEKSGRMDKMHGLLLTLLAKYSSTDTLVNQILPSSDMEAQASHQQALFSKKSVFHELVRTEMRHITRNLALYSRYLCVNMRAPISIGRLPYLFAPTLTPTLTMGDEPNAMSLSAHPPLYEVVKLLKSTLLNVENVLEEEKVIAKKHTALKDLNVSHLKELLLQEPEEIEFYDKKDLQDLAALSLAELQLEKSRGLSDYWVIIDSALLLLWIHLAKFLSRQDRAGQEKLTTGKGKQAALNIDSKGRKVLRQKATDLLLIHPNNMLDKIEQLENYQSNSNVQFIIRKIRELLRQGDS